MEMEMGTFIAVCLVLFVAVFLSEKNSKKDKRK